ncbi:poly-gamma-glutamate system protein [Leptospira broomii serovar Hurstbridge str. 5399]|uniref:Poly-gamma-glutamate system protein n=1 Tax=Leptospira broomii serovar Hurstbridge str. 5399 TaxID=1049789 RepID=T0GEA3_9LEPT|nr:poly-gamma-glutamate system protein [Leptospira broomii]EQA43738.1 poly-gamma-glutamate system protein [Leptospira broomii serovar Hurstbridge str. 5399]
MKKIYWRPTSASVKTYLLIAGISVFGLFLVETFKIQQRQPFYEQKMEASKTADEAFTLIRNMRIERGQVPDPEFDPARSGLIGSFLTAVTSNTGIITAKQTSVNPNFAGLLVDLLKKAGVEDGGTVAVGLSGSFPALNVCVYAAAKSLNLKLVSISSLSSSQWGANDPEFLWADMERELFKEKIFPYRSIALSYGGLEDRALGISPEGKRLLDESVRRNSLPLLTGDSFTSSLDERMRRFTNGAKGESFQAYINVGGGTISVGTKAGKLSFKPGLNKTLPPGAAKIDSVMTRFLLEDVPVIHLTEIEELAKKYGFPLRPKTRPVVGEGEIFSKEEYNRGFAGIVLLAILALVYFLFQTKGKITADIDSGLPF